MKQLRARLPDADTDYKTRHAVFGIRRHDGLYSAVIISGDAGAYEIFSRAFEDILVIDEFKGIHRFVKIEPDIIFYLLALYDCLDIVCFRKINSHAFFDIAVYGILGFVGESGQDFDMYARLFENLAYCGLLVCFASLDVTFGEAPV